jgi:hypothetical protein
MRRRARSRAKPLKESDVPANELTSRLSVVAPDLVTLVRPVPSDEQGARAPANSEVRKITDDVLGALKYSFAAVMAKPDAPVRANTVEALFKQSAQQMPEAKRKDISARAAKLVEASEEVRVAVFGRAGARSAEEHIGAGGGFDRYEEGLPPLGIDRKLLGLRTPQLTVPLEAVRASAEGLTIPAGNLPAGFESFAEDFESASQAASNASVVADERLADIWGATVAGDPYSGQPTEEFEEFAVTDKMGFWITRVKCVDETNPEWWGSDEIALAGVTVDEDGDTKKIAEKYIGGGFDDGDSKSYSNWQYSWFSMLEGKYWPKTYVVTLIMAEKDNGGLSSALNDIWEKVGAKVKQKIAEAVTAALSGYVGAAIAAAIGQAVAWAVDQFIQWLITLFNDDIFPPFIAKVTTPSMTARWNYPNGTWGNPSSGIRTGHFYGHGGHYLVDYYWKFFA